MWHNVICSCLCLANRPLIVLYASIEGTTPASWLTRQPELTLHCSNMEGQFFFQMACMFFSYFRSVTEEKRSIQCPKVQSHCTATTGDSGKEWLKRWVFKHFLKTDVVKYEVLAGLVMLGEHHIGLPSAETFCWNITLFPQNRNYSWLAASASCRFAYMLWDLSDTC